MHVHIALIGFDVTNKNSLPYCDKYIKKLRSEDPDVFNGVIVAFGTKIDLDDKRQMSVEEAHDHFAKMEPPVPYFETSAKTRDGVNELFEDALREWIRVSYYGSGKGNCIVC